MNDKKINKINLAHFYLPAVSVRSAEACVKRHRIRIDKVLESRFVSLFYKFLAILFETFFFLLKKYIKKIKMNI